MKNGPPRATVVLLLALALAHAAPGPDPAPASPQAARPETAAARERVRVLEPLPEEPAGELLERTVLSQRLVTPPEPSAARPPVAADPLAMIRGWAEAWSSQDVERYLSFYARDFRPADGRSREGWQAERRQRIAAPAFIQVDVSVVNEPRSLAPGRISVSLRQVYNSDTYSDVVDKELELVAEDGGWKISREAVP